MDNKDDSEERARWYLSFMKSWEKKMAEKEEQDRKEKEKKEGEKKQ